MLIRAYLDTSGSYQNLTAAKDVFQTFARRKGHSIGAYYNDQVQPTARASLFQLLRDKGLAIASNDEFQSEPKQQSADELFRLLKDARPSDVLLIERAKLLTRLAEDDWQRFRKKVKERKVRLVAMDLEASWVMVSGESAMAPMAEQLTAMMLDMLETLALQEDKERRNRQLEGIARAKSQGKYKGRPVDNEKHEQILALLQQGRSWSQVCSETGASRSTVARVVKLDRGQLQNN